MAVFNSYYFVVIACLILVEPVYSHSKLKYFETLKVSDFTRRVRRSVDPDPNSSAHLTELHVSTLGRKFHLFLKPTQIISSGFKAFVVKGNGQKEEFQIDRSSILSGKLEGDESARANVGYDENGLVSANIVTSSDTYVIEPSWPHLPLSGNHTMIAYRRSDVKLDGADHGEHKNTMCGIKEGWDTNQPINREELEVHGQMSGDINSTDENHRRDRRQSSPFLGTHTTCELMVVADYRFFENMGGYSVSATALYMIQTIQFVDSVYRKTQFDTSGGSMTDVGFQIGEMRIHSEATEGELLQSRTHYNVQTSYWDTTLLLEAFSTDTYFKKFCLSHLFTYRAFSGGVLGLAYIASDRKTAVGGMCSPYYSKYPGVKMTLNTGWSSSQNSGSHRLLSLQAWLVAIHELGHNLGSEHDPETDECAPSDFEKGKYVMYPWAVDGYDENNQVFSPCSKRYIYNVLKKKGWNCLIEGRNNGAFCGNGRIDEGETCDGGWATKNDEDFCCDANCQLRPKKLCSPMNFGCCNDLCQPFDNQHVCRPAQPWACLGQVLCDGVHKGCPNTANLLSDGKCVDEGVCSNGQCLNFCQLIDLKLRPCICPANSGKACHRCCKSDVTPCQSQMNDTLLPDGRPCFQGICKQGVCDKTRQDMVARLFNIIEDITIDQVVEFMKSNIVCTIIILSMVIWIPVSCAVSFLDRKKAKEENKKRTWMSRSNRTLVSEDDHMRIRRVQQPRTPRAIARAHVERGADVSRPPVENPFVWPSRPATRRHGPDDETVV